MKKISSLLLALLLLLSLGACAQKEPAPDTGAADAQVKTAPESSAPQENTPAADPLDFADEAALRAFLIGEWQYFEPYENTPALVLTLADDGGLRAERRTEAGGEAEYAGTWTLDRLYAEDSELPDWICTELDGGYDDLWNFGDFIIGPRTVCDGQYMMNWTQANNGDSVFSQHYSIFNPTLRKVMDTPAPAVLETRRTDERFYAICWKLGESDGMDVLWLDDTLDNAYDQNAGRYESVPYAVSTEADIRCAPSLFARGGAIAEVETDANGEIVMLNWAEREYSGEYGESTKFERYDSVIDGLHLYMTRDEVRAAFGEPENVFETRFDDGELVIVWYYAGFDLTFRDLYSQGDIILTGVNLYETSLPLANGLRLGFTAEEVMAQYDNDGLERVIGDENDPYGWYLYGEFMEWYGMPETYEQTGYRTPSRWDGSYEIVYACFTPMTDSYEQTQLIFSIDANDSIYRILWYTVWVEYDAENPPAYG